MEYFKKSLIFVLILTSFTLTAQEQRNLQQEENSFTDNLFLGGTFGLSFGDYTSVSISPVVGYQLNPKTQLGMRLEYQYISNNLYDYTYNQISNGFFGRYNIYNPIFIHAEFDFNWVEGVHYLDRGLNPTFETEWHFIPTLFLGGGVFYPASSNVNLYLEVLFEVLQDDKLYMIYNTTYPTAIRMGVIANI